MASGDDQGVSRRDFFKTVGASSVVTSVLSAGEVAGQANARVLGPGAVPVRLTINGRAHNLRIEPRVTLLDAIRNHADITGTNVSVTVAHAAPAP